MKIETVSTVVVGKPLANRVVLFTLQSLPWLPTVKHCAGHMTGVSTVPVCEMGHAADKPTQPSAAAAGPLCYRCAGPVIYLFAGSF